MSARGRWQQARRRRLGAIVVVLLTVGACTEAPTPPTPAPTATGSPEPAPSGVEVVVVLPEDDRSSLPLTDVEGQLDDLAQDRVGEIASIRAVTVDDPGFVADAAALVADEGADLVCVLGGGGTRTVLDLADRFPASQFCAIGASRDQLPGNVELFEIAHVEVGHLLGVAADELAGGGSVGLALGTGDERARRRAGLRAGLGDTALSLDVSVSDVEAATALVGAFDAATDDAEDTGTTGESGDVEPDADVPKREASLAVLVVDTASSSVADIVSPLGELWIGPADLSPETPADVRWSVRIDAIVGAAVDRLVASDTSELPTRLGSAEGVFTFAFATHVPEEVRDAIQVAADELGRGTRDPLVRDADDGEPSPP